MQIKCLKLAYLWTDKIRREKQTNKNITTTLNPSFTWISKCFILVPCWRSWMLSSFRSFCTNSLAALFFRVRREAQIALYSTVLSSLGFPLGLSITPTRTPGLAFCLRACTHTQTQQKYNSHKYHTISYFQKPQVPLRESTGGRGCWLLKSNNKGFSCSAYSTSKELFSWQIQNACFSEYSLSERELTEFYVTRPVFVISKKKKKISMYFISSACMWGYRFTADEFCSCRDTNCKICVKEKPLWKMLMIESTFVPSKNLRAVIYRQEFIKIKKHCCWDTWLISLH